MVALEQGRRRHGRCCPHCASGPQAQIRMLQQRMEYESKVPGDFYLDIGHPHTPPTEECDSWRRLDLRRQIEVVQRALSARWCHDQTSHALDFIFCHQPGFKLHCTSISTQAAAHASLSPLSQVSLLTARSMSHTRMDKRSASPRSLIVRTRGSCPGRSCG
jgi:hypothetical protein